MEENLKMPLYKVLKILQKRIMKQTSYLGIKTLQCPLDFWIYQEIIYETKPDFIIEIGTFHGGSTLALAHFCDIINNGKVIGIDISQKDIPEKVKNHPRIKLIEGDACASFPEIKEYISPQNSVLVIEDSSHTYENTLNVLRTYSNLIKPGDYFIVEDSICNHGLKIGPEKGPYEAIETFTKENKDFIIDRKKESFFITWNPKGFLKRKKSKNWLNSKTKI